MKVRINGLTINYQAYGDSSKKPILILHGWNHSSSIWAAWGHNLSRQGYFVVIPDLPACGQSSPLADPSVASYVATLHAFCDKLKLTDFTLIGHSFGAQLAVVLTSHTSVARLILVAPAIVRTHRGSSAAILRVLNVFAPLKHLLPRSVKYHISSGSDYAQSTPAQKRAMQQVLSDTTAETMMSQITIPTGIIWGEFDREIIGDGKALMSQIPNSRLKVIYNAGHNLHLEAPDMLQHHVRVFLEIEA